MSVNERLTIRSEQHPMFPRTYYVSFSVKLLYFSFFLLSCIITAGQVGRPNAWIFYFLDAFTGFIWLNAIMMRVVLYDDRIERIRWGVSTILMKKDITNYCKFRSYKSAALVFETKDSILIGLEIGNMRVPTTLKRDDIWDEWVEPLAANTTGSHRLA